MEFADPRGTGVVETIGCRAVVTCVLAGTMVIVEVVSDGANPTSGTNRNRMSVAPAWSETVGMLSHWSR